MLADYINHHSQGKALALLFKRESAGVYTFGTKRVFIKVENEKLIGNHIVL
jgi:hypothetical protein